MDPIINNTGRKDWGFLDFKIDELWKHSKGEGIKVALLDSGLNYKLSDFKNKIKITWYNADLDSIAQADCMDDTTGHGTDCAGMLCAQGISLFGAAPEIDLLVIRITNPKGERTSAAILKGLEKANEVNADVISLSFSMAKNDAYFNEIHARIIAAFQKGCTLIAAAGDSGGLSFPVDNFPAAFPEVISVGGIDRQRRRSKTSTKSNFLRLMGPGDDLFSVFNNEKRISGTSFATPFVAGVVAILKAVAKSENRLLTNSELFDILEKTADKNVSGTYSPLDFGWGILDPLAALSLLKQN